MSFFKLSFRAFLVVVCASIFAVCASAQFKGSHPGTILVSEGPVFAAPLEPGMVEKQVAPIPTWTALRREDGGGIDIETITSPKI